MMTRSVLFRSIHFAAIFLLAIFLAWEHESLAASAEDTAVVESKEKAAGGEGSGAEKEEEMIQQLPRTSPDSESTGPEQASYPGVTKKVITRNESGKPTVCFYYPSLGNSRVDASLKEFAEDAVKEFEAHQEGGDDMQNWDLSATYTISRPNEKFASVIFNIYSYEGGAHGNLGIVCLNYSLETGQLLQFSDIFQDPEKAVALMSDIAFQKFSKELANESDEDMIREGTLPKMENFDTLYLTSEGVVVEFPPYQVGPWSIGPQELCIPITNLAAARPTPLIWPEKPGKEPIGH